LHVTRAPSCRRTGLAKPFVLAIDDVEQLDIQYAVHHDEEKVIQTTMQAVAQLKELFEADARSRGELDANGKPVWAA
jgi:hypothetical protein